MNIKYIVESEYYSQSFDGAIFDGPFQISISQRVTKIKFLLHHLNLII